MKIDMVAFLDAHIASLDEIHAKSYPDDGDMGDLETMHAGLNKLLGVIATLKSIRKVMDPEPAGPAGDKDLLELKALHAKASDGHWGHYGCCGLDQVPEDCDIVAIGTTANTEPIATLYGKYHAAKRNLEFIAKAHEMVPGMVDELLRRRRE